MSTYAHCGHDATPPPEEINNEDAQRIFDEVAQRKLGISGEDFLRRWDEGRFANLSEENPRVQEVAMLIPLVRVADAR